MIHRVTFVFDDKTYQILAGTVDEHFHPYFVRITEIEFEDQSSIIITAQGDDARKRFGGVQELHIPAQQMRMVEIIESEEKKVTELRKVGD